MSNSEDVSESGREVIEGSLPPGAILACVLLALVGITVFTYYGILNADFVLWDDGVHVVNNPHIVPVFDAGYFWRHSYKGLYIPLSYMLFGLLSIAARMPAPNPDVTAVGGKLNPAVFHAASLLLHLTNVILVFFLIRTIVTRYRTDELQFKKVTESSIDIAAGFGALLFSLHPLQVESVAWISELRGLSSAACCLAALLLFDGPPAAFAMSLLLVPVAIIFKPSAIVLPGIFFILDRWIARRSWKASLFRILPLLVIALPLLLVTHNAQPVAGYAIIAPWQRPFIFGKDLAFYLSKLIVPWPLTIVYYLTPHLVLKQGSTYVIWVLPALVAVTIARYGSRLLKFASLLSLAFLLPVLGLFSFEFQELSIVADRYVYLAMIGPSIAIAALILSVDRMYPWRIVVPIVVVTILIAFSLLSRLRCRVWMNSDDLFADATRQNPKAYFLYTDWGNADLREGRIADGQTHFEDDLRINPGDIDTHVALANLMRNNGDDGDAAVQYQDAIELGVQDASVYSDLAQLFLAQGNLNAALQTYHEELALKPGSPEILTNCGVVLAREGNFNGAAQQFLLALQSHPGYGPAQTYYNVLKEKHLIR